MPPTPVRETPINTVVDDKTQQINQILQDLNKHDKFETGIQKLHQWLMKHPNDVLDDYLKDLSPHYQKFIKQHLEIYQNSLADAGATVEPAQPVERTPASASKFQARPSTSGLKFGQRPQTATNQFNQSSGTGSATIQAAMQQEE